MAAQNGIAQFIGLRSRKTYSVSFYLDDTAGNLVRFSVSGKAGATSPDYYQPPEPVVLRDFCIAAASGQTTTQFVANGVPTGDIILNAVHLASIATRPGLNIPFSPSYRMGAVQLA